jgi:nucleolar protein 56
MFGVVMNFNDLGTEEKSLYLSERRKPEYREEIIRQNLILVKQAISATVSEDTFIIQGINTVEELDKVCNTLVKRVREWYGYYFPEMGKNIEDNEVFIKTLLQKSKSEFMQEHNIDISMGPEISDTNLNMILGFARQANNLFVERANIINYLEDVMKVYCPNIHAVTGALIGAKLLEKAGSLKHMSRMPSSTIQLLGAEQALFRHLRNRKIRPPKHGFILSHPFVMNASRSDKGQHARLLAAKISIASKIDFFKGEFIGDKLRERLI